MKQLVGLAGITLVLLLAAGGSRRDSGASANEELPKPLAADLPNPTGIGIGTDNQVYFAVAGNLGMDGDGAIHVLKDGKAVPFAAGLDNPSGIVAFQQWLFVADKQRVWRIDRKGKADVFVAAAAFPSPPQMLTGITVDIESGILYVCDAGDGMGKRGAIWRINSKGKVDLVVDQQCWPGLRTPAGIAMDGASHLLILDAGSGELNRLRLSDKSIGKVADGFGSAAGIAWDKFGRLFVASTSRGEVFAIPRPGEKPIRIAAGFKSATDLCVDPSRKQLLVVDLRAGTLTALPVRIPGWEVDETPLPLETAIAFPDLQWTGWNPVSKEGKLVPLRPIFLTHAGDGSNRVFVATQHGVIHVFPNDQKATTTKVFLDIQDRVTYSDNQNEEGFLGLAFHPRFKENGEFFVFYTTKKAKLVNVVSRFRVSKNDLDRADPDSEEIILQIPKPFWNHDGGTICFGPDGYLYITHGDGGAANDPFNNGQNLKTLLGSIMRIDVNRKDPGKNYAIPPDNPFVNRADAAGEIWAYGLRNVWRMAFDRKTGQLWAGEVGQNLYEEINLIVKGGNYGWKLRESLHPFGAQGVGERPDLIEPIWEYHHDIGKSITGGSVYRGKRLPELDGAYLYADYVTGRIWALRYDETRKRVVANHPIRDRSVPILSFGEDETGEVYLLAVSGTGKGISWLVPAKGKQ